ncbi:MAG: DnaJ domain-containing protein [Bdellovibrionota bacterium]
MAIQLTDDFENKNYYELLGVARDASTEVIKDAYREIARIYHPDSNYYEDIIKYKLSNRDKEIFQRVTAAYHTLVKPDKRKEYDRTLPVEAEEDWSEPTGRVSQSIKAWNTPITDASMKLVRMESKARVKIKKPETVILQSPVQNVPSPQTETGRPMSVAEMAKMNHPPVETQAEREKKRKQIVIGGAVALAVTLVSAVILLLRH